MSHHVLKKSLQTFGNDIQAFGSEISNEIDVLKKRVSLEKSITGASTYKNCIEDLKERVEETASLIKDISGVSNASVSTQEYLRRCMTLFDAVNRTMEQSELKLQQYGYKKPESLFVPGSLLTSSEATLQMESERDKNGEQGSGIRAEIKDKLAPLTAAKARMQNRDDTPSSLSSPDSLTPSMQRLLGKYASPSSKLIEKAQSLTPRLNSKGGPTTTISPVFAKAFQEQTELCEKTSDLLDINFSSHKAGATPGLVTFGKIAVVEEAEADPGMISAYPSIPDSIRQKYQVMNTNQQRSPSFICLNEDDDDFMAKYYDAQETELEETTLELRSQVIFDRKNCGNMLGQGMQFQEPLKDLQDLPELEAIVKKSGAPVRSSGSLEEAISAALSRRDFRAEKTPSGTGQSSTTGLIPSTLSARKTSATASLPSSVPPLKVVEDGQYAELPAFIRGQISLQVLNEATASVHSLVENRLASGGSVGFTCTDVESVSPLPSGKGKVLLNALAKLERVHLKVIYGQGTLYYFV